jgi:ankyrin repeat protein
MVKLLLSYGPDLEHGAGKEWRTPLMLAAKRGHPEVARVLVEAGADPEYHSGNGLTPIMEAASAKRGSEQHAATVSSLIEAGANVHKENYVNGNTALHYAAVTASLESAKLLVAAGANATAENNDGYTPMDYANRHRWNYDMRVWFRELGAECTLGEDCRDDSKGRPDPPKSTTTQRIDL